MHLVSNNHIESLAVSLNSQSKRDKAESIENLSVCRVSPANLYLSSSLLRVTTRAFHSFLFITSKTFTKQSSFEPAV